MQKIEHPIGWIDDSDPNGIGYQIMTDTGLETYDITEHDEFLARIKQVNKWLEMTHGGLRSSQLKDGKSASEIHGRHIFLIVFKYRGITVNELVKGWDIIGVTRSITREYKISTSAISLCIKQGRV